MIVVYDRQGKIEQTVDDPYPPELIARLEERAVEEADFNFHDEPMAPIHDRYVDVVAGCLCERPDMPVAVDGLTLTGVPEGAVVDIDHGALVVEATASEIELQPEDAGTYVVQVRQWPFKDFSVEVEARP